MTNREQKPNLVFVFADQLSRNRLGFFGDAKAQTPYLDALFARSAVMTNACSGHPLGGPYRACLFTGKYVSDTGMAINALRLHPRHRFIGQILTENGYSAEFIGKWNLYADKLGAKGAARESFIPPGRYRFGFDGYFAAYDYHHRYFAPEAFYHLDSPARCFPRGFEPDDQTRLAIERLRKHKADGAPFALFLSFGAPHGPWERSNVPADDYAAFEGVDFAPPENYAEKTDPHADAWSRLTKQERKGLPQALRCYYALTRAVDRNVGALCAALEETGLAENTLFVFTSDHGELFGAHGRCGKNIFYDEAVSVPLLLRFGSRLPTGENRTPVNTVDLMPTLLSLLGIADRGDAAGEDLSGAIESGAFLPRCCLLTGTGPANVWGNGREWRAVRNERYTYAVYRSGTEEFLFDNALDPLQIDNLAEDRSHAEIKETLSSELRRIMLKIGDAFPPNSYYKNNMAVGRKTL